ncbi:putative alkyl hydroperoxide reductase subunit [Plesiocystis pacifica SIR-1]|uniref:Thioredoxin peroxidase n=1 Tax=Plesiocystis pacifica SIR-1 TaxID=391625 RepID=A6G393_9BACT|nr:peroxiredoxin [Plesiocystis pacifica]EDM79718.1 putative alkyl hydroperoxide reductase subunit [Plesiocystis pacifica SIR-1]
MAILVGKPAPNFNCSAVLADGTIDEAFEFASATKGKYALVFFYPLDFTFVCPSELIALDHRVTLFRERNVEVIGVSVDSAFTHAAWRNTSLDDGGIGAVKYTLAADLKHEIVSAYGIETADGVALRAAFLIDREGVVRSQIVNDLPLGRNIDELLRLVDALQFHEEHGDVCPAGWNKGDAGMTATAEGVASYLADHGERL